MAATDIVSATPRIDYLSRDYAGLRDAMLGYASAVFPDWQPASEGDIAMMLVELFAYMGDIQSFYVDRAQMENFLTTATQRESVLAIAYELGYTPTSGAPAKGTVTLVADVGVPATLLPAGTQFLTGRVEAVDGPIKFELDADTTVPVGATPAVTVVANVTEGETVTFAKIAESTGQPSQQYVLPNTGVYPATIRVFVEDVEGSTQIVDGTSVINAREWSRVDHLLDADFDENVFEAVLTTSDSTSIRFGDDINGAIPSTGLQVFTSFRHGFGSAGSVAAGQVYLVNDRSLRGIHILVDDNTQPQSGPMTGGADAESTDSIRYNAPRAYRTQGRAVTARDYRDIALGVEGVSKANVVAGTFTSVTLYITGADGGAPTQTLLDYVASKFTDSTKLMGVDVTVASPTFIPVNFGTSGTKVTVDLFTRYSQAAVKAAVRRAIKDYVGNLRFGQKLTVGKVYDVVSAVDGVNTVDIPVMARNDATQSGTVAITPRSWEVLTVGTINLDATGGVA